MTNPDVTGQALSRRRLIQVGTAAGASAVALGRAGSLGAAPGPRRSGSAGRSQESVEIKLAFHFWAGWEDALKAIIQGFETANPGVKVNYELIPFDDLETTLTPRFAAKDPPDLVISNGGFPWAAQGLLLDLRDLITRDSVDVTLLADTLAIGRVLGTEPQLGLPVYLTGGLIFFNKTLFDKYSVPHPAQGWTMDDFRTTAIALTRDGDDRSPADAGFDAGSIAHYGAHFGGGQQTEPFVRNFGGHFFNPDYTAALLTDPATAAAYTFLHELGCTQQAMITPDPSQQAPVDPFVSQQAAMTINGEWQFSLYQGIEDFDWDSAPPPQGPAGYPDGYHVYAASDTMGIAKDSKHPDEAWEFLKYLCFEPSAQLDVAGSLGPALKSVAGSPEFLAKRTGTRGPSTENVTWSYQEMGAHSALEYYLGTTKNVTKWGPVYNDFQVKLLTLCSGDPDALLQEYNDKITAAINDAS